MVLLYFPRGLQVLYYLEHFLLLFYFYVIYSKVFLQIYGRWEPFGGKFGTENTAFSIPSTPRSSSLFSEMRDHNEWEQHYSSVTCIPRFRVLLFVGWVLMILITSTIYGVFGIHIQAHYTGTGKPKIKTKFAALHS